MKLENRDGAQAVRLSRQMLRRGAALAALFGIGMPANDAFFWLIWGSLLRETAKENGNH